MILSQINFQQVLIGFSGVFRLEKTGRRLGAAILPLCLVLSGFGQAAQTITATPGNQNTYTGQAVHFSAWGSNTGYTWTGGPTGSGSTASATWTTPGTYTVSVKAPASGTTWAASNTVSLSVTVLAPQAQTITAAPDGQSVYANQLAYFSASGSNTGYNWTGANGNATQSA
jgi:hypothetical protein